MLITTGRGPVKRAGGLYRRPLISRPSKLSKRTSSVAANPEATSPPVSLSVQRSTLPLGTSIE